MPGSKTQKNTTSVEVLDTLPPSKKKGMSPKKSAAKPAPKKNVKKPVATPNVQETPAETPETPIIVETKTPGGTRRERREVTAETVDSNFATLLDLLQEEIEKQTKSENKNPAAIRTLRNYVRQVKTLRADTSRIARKKRKNVNTQSGFKKPALITDELADFLGLEHGSRISRVDCTRGLQAYIIKHNLQNPECRKIIVPDKALSKLLNYNKARDGDMMYYHMQKLIQPHFIKETPAN